MKYAWIENNKLLWPVCVQCRVLGVSASGYRQHRARRKKILTRRYLSETAEGWLYLAVVLDLYSRKIVGWSMGSRMTADLPLAALRMAFLQRHPAPGLMHHSDRGSQYASQVYQHALQGMQMTCSMSRKGDCCDNAVVESFFASLKREECDGASYSTRDIARQHVFAYLEQFYNRKRRHSSLGYVSPAEFEAQHPASLKRIA